MRQEDEETGYYQVLSVNKITMLAMVIFSIGYMISEPNLDSFNLEEALEYIYNERLDSLPVHVAGFLTSFISNIPLLATILYCWAYPEHPTHDHENNEHEDDEHGNEEQHSVVEEITEMVTIGVPFALMGSAAYLDTMTELSNVNDLTPFEQVLFYFGASFSGMITGFGAYKLHGFHAHASMRENGGGITGFFKGLSITFVQNVWSAKDDHDTNIKKTLAVLNEIWKKYGIVGVHGFLGNFAANVFLNETGIAGKTPAFDLILKICLPLAVMLFEGNTEARSLDAHRAKHDAARRLLTPLSYSLYSKLVVLFSSCLHTVPAITSLAMMMGSFESGPFEGSFYNALIYLAASFVLAYPSVYGFFATTLPGFDKAVTGLKDHLKHRLVNEEPLLCARLLTKLGFHNSRRNNENLQLSNYGSTRNGGDFGGVGKYLQSNEYNYELEEGVDIRLPNGV